MFDGCDFASGRMVLITCVVTCERLPARSYVMRMSERLSNTARSRFCASYTHTVEMP